MLYLDPLFFSALLSICENTLCVLYLGTRIVYNLKKYIESKALFRSTSAPGISKRRTT